MSSFMWIARDKEGAGVEGINRPTSVPLPLCPDCERSVAKIGECRKLCTCSIAPGVRGVGGPSRFSGGSFNQDAMSSISGGNVLVFREIAQALSKVSGGIS